MTEPTRMHRPDAQPARSEEPGQEIPDAIERQLHDEPLDDASTRDKAPADGPSAPQATVEQASAPPAQAGRVTDARPAPDAPDPTGDVPNSAPDAPGSPADGPGAGGDDPFMLSAEELADLGERAPAVLARLASLEQDLARQAARQADRVAESFWASLEGPEYARFGRGETASLGEGPEAEARAEVRRLAEAIAAGLEASSGRVVELDEALRLALHASDPDAAVRAERRRLAELAGSQSTVYPPTRRHSRTHQPGPEERAVAAVAAKMREHGLT
jgi:hypothetical protein